MTGAVHLVRALPSVPHLLDRHYYCGKHVYRALELCGLQDSDGSHILVPVTWFAAPVHISAAKRGDEARVFLREVHR